MNFTLATFGGSPTQLSASWSGPIPKNGIITGYTVYCNTSANQSYPGQVIGSNVPTIVSVVNGKTLAVNFTGLNPYTNIVAMLMLIHQEALQPLSLCKHTNQVFL